MKKFIAIFMIALIFTGTFFVYPASSSLNKDSECVSLDCHSESDDDTNNNQPCLALHFHQLCSHFHFYEKNSDIFIVPNQILANKYIEKDDVIFISQSYRIERPPRFV